MKEETQKPATETPVIPRIPVVSKAVRSIGYAVETKTCAVEWNGGAVYHYPNYEQADFEKLRKAESTGTAAADLRKLPCVKITIK